MDKTLLESLRQDLLRMLEMLGIIAKRPPILPLEPPIIPSTTTTPPLSKPVETSPKHLWDTTTNARHSVRVICDEMGLTLAEKNLITAVVQAESGFKNTAICRNKSKAGILLSTDWGICQINDYWHVGAGKHWSSVQQVLDNPDKEVKWMIALYKQGKLNLWVAYSSGAYKKYL